MNLPVTQKKQPLDVVTAKGIRIPIYDAGNGKAILAYYAEGKRKLVKCQSLDAGRQRARELVEELTSGAAHVRALTPKELAVIDSAVAMLRPLGVSLLDAVRQYVDAVGTLKGAKLSVAAEFYSTHVGRQTSQSAPAKFPDIVKSLLESLEAQGRSERHRVDIHSRLKRAAKAFRGNIAQITSTDIETWLKTIKARGRTWNNYRGAFCTLFSYARGKGMLPRGQKTEAELVARATENTGEIGIYTPTSLQNLLSVTEERFVPFVALGAFAGIRTAEIRRMDWRDIRMDDGHIIMTRGKTKTAQRRIIPIQPCLREWLEPYVQPEGPVAPVYRRDGTFLRAFRKGLPEGTKLVHNGLRHSYASYRLAVIKSAEQVALEMGNSPRKLFSNYRELVTEAQAKAYFSIIPPARLTPRNLHGNDSGNAK